MPKRSPCALCALPLLLSSAAVPQRAAVLPEAWLGSYRGTLQTYGRDAGARRALELAVARAGRGVTLAYRQSSARRPLVTGRHVLLRDRRGLVLRIEGRAGVPATLRGGRLEARYEARGGTEVLSWELRGRSLCYERHERAGGALVLRERAFLARVASPIDLEAIARRSDLVVVARVAELGPPPPAWCGIVVTWQVVRFRVERVLAGKFLAKTIAVTYLCVARSPTARDDGRVGLAPAYFAPGRRLVLGLELEAAPGGGPGAYRFRDVLAGANPTYAR